MCEKLGVGQRVETCQTDAPGNSGRKGAENVNGWGQPFGQSGVATARFVKFLNLTLKYGEDGIGRIAGLKLSGKRVFEKVVFGLPLVGLQRCFEDRLES